MPPDPIMQPQAETNMCAASDLGPLPATVVGCHGRPVSVATPRMGQRCPLYAGTVHSHEPSTIRKARTQTADRRQPASAVSRGLPAMQINGEALVATYGVFGTNAWCDIHIGAYIALSEA